MKHSLDGAMLSIQIFARWALRRIIVRWRYQTEHSLDGAMLSIKIFDIWRSQSIRKMALSNEAFARWEYVVNLNIR